MEDFCLLDVIKCFSRVRHAVWVTHALATGTDRAVVDDKVEVDPKVLIVGVILKHVIRDVRTQPRRIVERGELALQR